MASSEEIAKLAEKLKDSTFFLGVRNRRAAVRRLGEIGSAETILHLVRATKDEDAEVQNSAVNAIKSLKNPEAIKALREYYKKNKQKSIWKIIKEAGFIPHDMKEKLQFYIDIGADKEIEKMVNPENFEEILDIIMEIDISDPKSLIERVLPQAGDEENVKQMIIKKYLNSKNENLFIIIHQKNWYPPELMKKLLFLLKFEKYDVVCEMLDHVDFKKVLELLISPQFPMQKEAHECLSMIRNPIIIDEICQVYLREGNETLGDFIVKNSWSPNSPRDKVFFYLKTQFLKPFFKEKHIDPDLVGGYLEVPHVQKIFKEEDYRSISTFMVQIATQLAQKVKVEFPEDNPLIELRRKVSEYVDHKKPPEVVDEICAYYLEHPTPFLKYMILHMNWSPEGIVDKIKFYLKTDQLEKCLALGPQIIKIMSDLMESSDEELKTKSLATLKMIKDPDAVDQVFNLYFTTKDPTIDQLIKEKKWQPTDKKERALYFVYSGQIERYREIEKEGFKILTSAYQSLDRKQRFNLLDIIIKHRSAYFIDFLIHLLEMETNPRILKLLCTMVPVFYPDILPPLQKTAVRLEGPALLEIVKALAFHSGDKSLEVLYEIAKSKTGFDFFWILKHLEMSRFQPKDPRERNFYYEMFKLKDDLLRFLKEALVDENPSIRESSANIYAQLGDERELHTLMQCVEDPNENVKMAVAYALGRLCGLSPENAVKQIETFRISSIYMIFNDVKKAFMAGSDMEQIATLGESYRVGSKVLRTFTVAVLEVLQRSESVPTLIHALTDEIPQVRKSALRALKEIMDPRCIDAVFKYMEDEDPEVRSNAAETIGRISNVTLEEKLIKRTLSGDSSFVDGYIRALGVADPVKHREFLEKLLNRPDFNFTSKTAIIITLGEIGDDEAIRTLVSTFNAQKMLSSKANEQIPFIKALGKIGSIKAYRQLEEALLSDHYMIRKEALKALSHIEDRVALVAIIKKLDDVSGWVQMQALESLVYYFNNHFVFQETDKDAKFVGAIIARLKKFTLHPIVDNMFPVYKIHCDLANMLLKERLTRIYLTYKHKQAEKTDEPGEES